MRKSEIIKKNVISILKSQNRWMTANELIEVGNQEHLMGLTKKNTFRYGWGTKYEGHSHPVFRVLSGMTHMDEHNIYSPEVIRRIRMFGPETGRYEYAMDGLSYQFRRYMSAIKNA